MSNPANGTLDTLRARLGNNIPVAMQAVVAQVNVADPAALTDLNVAFLSMDAAGRLRVLASAVPGSVFSTTPAILANSVNGFGTQTAPAAGTTIASIAAGNLPAGTYDVQVAPAVLSGGGAGDSSNMQFLRGATIVGTLIYLINTSPVVGRVFRCVLDGATAVSVQNIAVAGAGSVYQAELIATRIA